MTDRYLTWVQSPWGARLSKALSLPQPSKLLRRGDTAKTPPAVMIYSSSDNPLAAAITSEAAAFFGAEHLLASDGSAHASHPKISHLLFDASSLQSVDDLGELHRFFSQHLRQLGQSARVIIFGRPPQNCQREHRVAQRALEGFMRSLCKELRHGSTGQLVYVAEGAEDQLGSTLRFFGSARSAYVSGQVLYLQASGKQDAQAFDWNKPLAGKKALVTGAARGIGAAIAQTLSDDGVEVIGLDVPAASEALDALMQKLNGHSISLDITAANAPQILASELKEQHHGVDIVVHNAGVTRDKLLANMDQKRWQMALDINLAAPLRINQALLDSNCINDGGRIIGVSSISGIAGNAGQTNYSASKAGIIGMVDAFAALPNKQAITCNAVAPGFIETEMTAKVPFMLRQAGRRMNTLKQGGLPVDVAETIAWLASPASGGVNGNTVRVCGQSLLGA